MKTTDGTTTVRQRGKNGKKKELWGHKFKTVDNELDQVEIFSFLGSRIEENNTLLKKIQNIDSLVGLAEKYVAGARKQAERIMREAEEEASTRAHELINDAEERARTESDSITSEARLEAEKSAQEKLEEATRKAEEETSRLLAAANEKADELVKQRMARAEEEAHEFVKQKKEQFKKTYQKLVSSLDTMDLSDIYAKLSQDDILSISEESEEPLAPQNITTYSIRIPYKVLPGFLRRRINKS